MVGQAIIHQYLIIDIIQEKLIHHTQTEIRIVYLQIQDYILLDIKIVSPYAGRYECRGDTHNSFDIDEFIDTIGLFIIPEGSHYYTDGYFYASDTLKLLRTLPKNKFFNYMMNR